MDEKVAYQRAETLTYKIRVLCKTIIMSANKLEPHLLSMVSYNHICASFLYPYRNYTFYVKLQYLRLFHECYNIPVHVGYERYDYNFKAQLVLQKYDVAVPFNCQKSLQGLLGFLLPLDRQWIIINEVTTPAFSVFPEIEKIAGNGEVTHNDDLIDMV